MKSTAILSKFFGIKELSNLSGYRNSDGTECKSKLQGFAAEIRKLTPEDKEYLVTEAARELSTTVDR